MRKKILFVSLCVCCIVSTFSWGYYTIKQSIESAEIEDISTHSVPYEPYFRQYAPAVGWDWELLAALCWCESRYNPEAQSPSGAIGLMQLMPKTATRFGLNDSTILIPKENIRAGVEYIAYLQQMYSFISNKEEQTKFVLASYNSGPAHVMDARRLAKRYGRSPYVWFDNTEYWLSQLQNPEIAADSVVRYGSFNAAETTSYVRKVLRTYNKLQTSKDITR